MIAPFSCWTLTRRLRLHDPIGCRSERQTGGGDEGRKGGEGRRGKERTERKGKERMVSVFPLAIRKKWGKHRRGGKQMTGEETQGWKERKERKGEEWREKRKRGQERKEKKREGKERMNGRDGKKGQKGKERKERRKSWVLINSSPEIKSSILHHKFSFNYFSFFVSII